MLAGHSFGGLYVLTFAARYPDEVAGMVLVDSTAPDRRRTGATSPGDEGSYDIMGRVSALVSSSARLGSGRLLRPVLVSQPAAAVLPTRYAPPWRPPACFRSTIDEYLQATASMEQAAASVTSATSPWSS